jgi:hypothetical protein
MSVTLILADGSTDQYTDHAPPDTIDGEHSYWITAAGHLTVYRRHPRTGPDDHPETIEAIYSPTGWLKVTGQQRDEEPPGWAAS